MLTHFKHSNAQSNTEDNFAHRSNKFYINFIQEKWHEYQKRAQQVGWPLCENLTYKQQSSEYFHLTYRKKRFHLQASNSLGALYGLHRLEMIARSGYFADLLGDVQPQYTLRPLWVCSDQLYTLAPNLGISLPTFMQNKNRDEIQIFCKQVLAYGFNAVILGSLYNVNWATAEHFSFSAFNELCAILQESGLKVIVKPVLSFVEPLAAPDFTCCPCDPRFQNALVNVWKIWQGSCVDGFIWESLSAHPQFAVHSAAEALTLVEIAATELQLLEQQINQKHFLIFYLAASEQQLAYQHSQWLPFLSERAAKNTCIAFSAQQGGGVQLKPHPIWEQLKRLHHPLGTPLLPLLNGGALQQGEGLWPHLNLKEMNDVFQRCHFHPFKGVAILTRRIPAIHGLLSCNLWVVGQLSWQARSAFQWAEVWFKAFKSDMDFSEWRVWFEQLTNSVVELDSLRFLAKESSRDIYGLDECRAKAEALFAQLDILQRLVTQEKKLGEIRHYFNYFYRDARRVILHFLQSYNIPLTHMLTGEDMQPGFWTTASAGQRNGIKIIFNQKPYVEEKDSKMQMIYQDNNLFNI